MLESIYYFKHLKDTLADWQEIRVLSAGEGQHFVILPYLEMTINYVYDSM